MSLRPLLALGLCVFVCVALVETAASARSGSGALPPPRLRPASGWVVIKPGPSEPTLAARMVVAVTAHDAAALEPFAPFVGFKRLRPRGILVWQPRWDEDQPDRRP